MNFNDQLYGVKLLIRETNKISTIQDIFLYIRRKPLAEKTGINYGRFLHIVKKPKSITKGEIAKIALAIGLESWEVVPLFNA